MSRRGGGRRSSEPRRDQDSSNPSPSFQRGGDGGRGRGRGGRGGFTTAPSPIPVRAPHPAAPGYLSVTAGPSTSLTPRETVSSSTPPLASSSASPPASSSASVEAISQEIEKKLSFKSITATGGSVPVSSKAIVPPPRPQYGSKGRKCVIRANHFVVEVSDRDLFQYDVAITPEVPSKKVNRDVISQLVRSYRESHLGNRMPAYDGRKSLYTAGALPFEAKEFVVKLVEKNDPASSSSSVKKERQFNVAIKYASKVDTHHLKEFLSGRQKDVPQETIQILDIVLRASPSEKYVTAGRSFFSLDLGPKGELGNGVEYWRGYYQSLRPTQMGLSLNIDVSARSFYEPIWVTEFVAKHFNLRDLSRPLSDQDRVKVKRALRGIKVEISYRDYARSFKVTGISNLPVNKTMFTLDDKKVKVSVEQYFWERYKIGLQYTSLPPLQAGTDAKPIYLPMELCKIVPPKCQLSNSETHITNMMLFYVFTLLLLSTVAASKSIINSLPGFDGNLPFVLETGYIGVGELEAVQLFYYFIESERSPEDDPLVLWLTGGPGCSALSGLVYEIGPLAVDYAKSSRGGQPVFALNPYSWTKIANIIFVDAPAGTGFSYSTTLEGYDVSDTLSAAQTYEFLRKWLVDHPEFLTNPLYVAGDSYSGIIAPIIVQEISDGNEVGDQPTMNLKGYVLGNPVTDDEIDTNSIVPFAHLKALISDELYESFMKNCKGEYLNPDQSNASCMEDILAIKECIGKLFTGQILEPLCKTISPKPIALKLDPRFLIADETNILLSSPHVPRPWCRHFNYVYIYKWANDETVQDALHIRKGTKKHWERCNKTLAYSYNVKSSVDYHRNLTKKPYRALIYSGDHDMTIPYIGTHEWIESLNLTIKFDWEPWFVDGQVAGYTMLYAYNELDYITYDLRFATVKGGGHTAPEYRPEQCLAMIDRWFDYYPL